MILEANYFAEKDMTYWMQLNKVQKLAMLGFTHSHMLSGLPAKTDFMLIGGPEAKMINGKQIGFRQSTEMKLTDKINFVKGISHCGSFCTNGQFNFKVDAWTLIFHYHFYG